MAQENGMYAGPAGSAHVNARPLTTDLVNAADEGILVPDIDSKLVKIRPMATPLDQISRLGHVRQVNSMEVDYYSIDTRIDTCEALDYTVKTAKLDDGSSLGQMTVENPDIAEVSDILLTEAGAILYVSAKDGDVLEVVSRDVIEADSMSGAKIMRLGRAATQLDVQSPQFAVLPHRKTNFCQIFKQQIEQSVILRDSHKRIGWDLTDQQEAALYDMRLGMERQFLFGKKLRLFDPVKQENVTITGGVWSQAGKDLQVPIEGCTQADLVDLMRNAFTENSGSRRKVLIAGSGLIASLNKADATRVLGASDTVTYWGIDFSEIRSKFGRLYVVFSDVFDSMGHANDGMVIDPEYLQKHVFIPMRAERIDLRGSGQRNTEAVVLTEASCLTLRYPDAHARVSGV